MSSLPCAKVPFLLCGSWFTHLNWTAPNPPPKAEEQVKYSTARSVTEQGPYTLLDCAKILKLLYHSLNVLEAFAVLAYHLRKSNPSLLGILPSAVRSVPRLGPLLEKVVARLANVGGSIKVTKPFLSYFLVMAAGTFLRTWAIRTLGRLFTYQLAVRTDHQLITSGPYSVVRHPSYTGAQIAIVGTALSQLAPGSLWARWNAAGGWNGPAAKLFAGAYVANWIYLWSGGVTRAIREDSVLREEFRSEWTAWAERTPYRLYPYLF